MSNNKMREEFEAWWIDSKHDGEPDFIKRAMCAAWQASRAALVVELPEHIPDTLEVRGIKYAPNYAAGINQSIDECRAAIEAAGVRCKG